MLPATGSEIRFCSQCGQSLPIDDLARFGDQLVCSSCKDLFAQRLREGVATSTAFEYAGFWIRVLAALIDGVILFVIRFVMQMAFSPVLTRRDPMGAIGVMLFLQAVGIAMGACYEGFLIARHGATPGKMAVGIQVVRADGSPVPLGRAFGRYFAKMVSAIILGIGYVMVAFDGQKRGLHDMICETRVIKAR